jgi:tRNA pseudouridine13 synthase
LPKLLKIKNNTSAYVRSTILNKLYYLNHSKIDAYFKQSVSGFVVTEIPLYEFSKSGEHLIIKVRKKDLTTWDMISDIASFVGCKSKDIGYAGLKDKNAMTIQYISIHRQYEEKLKTFSHQKIKILETTYHNNKIKIGHLKGNKFFIRLKRVQNVDKMKLESALQSIAKYGMANYFGFQRFGIDGDNYLKGKQIVVGNLRERNKKLKQMYINAYQSYLFNNWLSKRIEISKLLDNFKAVELKDKLNLSIDKIKQIQSQQHPFKIFQGDLMHHYPYGKIFYATDLESESEKFLAYDRVPTGLLCGKKVKLAQDDARNLEKEFDVAMNEYGSRRFAWVFPTEIQSEFKEEKNWFELNFSLPKGSYATELIAELLH